MMIVTNANYAISMCENRTVFFVNWTFIASFVGDIINVTNICVVHYTNRGNSLKNKYYRYTMCV